jgi:cell wall-associated NlpC family hydrolase
MAGFVSTDLRDLIGIPFVDGGRDPVEGLDCWGLLILAAKHFGYDVPDFDISCFDAPGINEIYKSETDTVRWRQRRELQPGYVIAMALSQRMPDAIQHFGIYIGEGKFLHTVRKAGSCLSSIDAPLWKNKIKGYYEWIGNK